MASAIILRVGDRIRGPLGDFDPLIQVPFKRARTRVQKGPLLRGPPYYYPKPQNPKTLKAVMDPFNRTLIVPFREAP